MSRTGAANRKQQPLWIACVAAVGLTAGCGGGGSGSSGISSPPPPPPPPPPATAFTGVIRSGSTPVSGAAISFYAAGTTGPGTGATNLLSSSTITSDANGKFSVPVFTCPSSSSQVYLVGRGGSTNTSGSDNSALVMMAPLGNCGSIGSSTAVVMDEVTTAASAWALAQFMGPGAQVGASSTNTAGIQNAFLTINNLVDVSKGTAPGPALPSSTVIETAKLNSLANVLAACDQSSSGSVCDALFSAATQGSSSSSNTLDAALAIVRHPGSNVAAVFALQTSAAFQPALTAAPHDWTLSATIGNCASGCGGLNLPGSLAMDSKGNVWVANYFGGAVSEFSPSGAPLAPNGIAATGIQSSFGIAVDAQNSVWVTNESGTSAAGTSKGSITSISNSGQVLSGNGYTAGGINYPIAIAATSGGNIWVADYAGSAATLLKSDGSAISGSSGYAAAALPFANAVAVDASQNGWFVFQAGVARVTQANGVTVFPCCQEPAGIAIDASGQVWVADYGASALIELSSSGAILGQATGTGGLNSPAGIAVDGSGNVWIANYRGETLSEFADTTTQPLSPGSGYGLDAQLHEPFGLGIDASGNLWISNAGSNTLSEFIGVATPVKTPLLGTPVQP